MLRNKLSLLLHLALMIHDLSLCFFMLSRCEQRASLQKACIRKYGYMNDLQSSHDKTRIPIPIHGASTGSVWPWYTGSFVISFPFVAHLGRWSAIFLTCSFIQRSLPRDKSWASQRNLLYGLEIEVWLHCLPLMSLMYPWHLAKHNQSVYNLSFGILKRDMVIKLGKLSLCCNAGGVVTPSFKLISPRLIILRVCSCSHLLAPSPGACVAIHAGDWGLHGLNLQLLLMPTT